MNPNLLIAFVVAAGFAQANGACLCSFGEGKDMCHTGTSSSSSGGSKSCSPLVIRPIQLPKFSLTDVLKPRVVCKQITHSGLVKPFSPIGDLCSCKQSIVTPAFVPRPSCASCNEKKFSESTIFSSSHHHGSEKRTHRHERGSDESEAIYVPHGDMTVDTGYIGTPADPVSLSLAYAAQQKHCTDSDHKLQYGFRNLPKDGSRAKVAKHVIREEDLHGLKGKIVEMRPYKCAKAQKSIDEEAYDDLMALQEEAELHNEESYAEERPQRPSYRDIGFQAAKPISGSFRATNSNIESMGFGSDSSESTESIESGLPCNDGFVPGNVIIKNIPQREIYVSGHPPPSDCSEEESPRRYVSYSTSQHTNEHHKTHHSSSQTVSGCH